MRLVCPNCAAQYEVGADVIPEAGRDVQCSNCGHTWFQASAAVTEAAPPPETAQPEPAAAAEAAGAPAIETDQQRRTLDVSVLNILREEAEREARARQAEAGTLESQPDLGLTAAPEEVPSPEEDEEAETEDFVAPVGAASGARTRDASPEPRAKMLPDIEQINSTLRASSGSAADALAAATAERAEKRRVGFRRGFVPVMVLALSALVIYLSAPRLISSFPAAGPMLTAYVSEVDRGRFWLDDRMRGVTVWLQGETATESE